MRTIAWVALLGAVLTMPLAADDPEPDAKQALLAAGRALSASEGYSLSYDLRLGLIPLGATSVSSPSVTKSYSGDVYRGVLHLSSPDVYLSLRGGSAKDPRSSKWRQIAMFEEYRPISQILQMPEEHIAIALKSARSARFESGTIVVETAFAVAKEALNTIQNSGCTGAT